MDNKEVYLSYIKISWWHGRLFKDAYVAANDPLKLNYAINIFSINQNIKTFILCHVFSLNIYEYLQYYSSIASQ